MRLSKQRGDVDDDWRNKEILRLPQLTLLTTSNIPANILVHLRPPESNKKISGGRVKSFVTKCVVSILNKLQTFRGEGNKLRGIVLSSTKKLLIQ